MLLKALILLIYFPPASAAPMIAAAPDVARQRKRRIAPIIVTALAAAKIAANKRSPRAKARPQPKAASTKSARNSRRTGSVQGAFMWRLL
jgi:hypothetical protein